MKAFVWLLTLALILVCLAGWTLAGLVERSMRDVGMVAPYFTNLVILPHGWLLLVPLPWIVYAAVLTFRRGELTAAAAFLFAGTVSLCATSLVCALGIAIALPYIPRHA